MLSDRLLPALCWTLVHSLWLGLVLTVLGGGIMVVTKRSAAALRYVLLCSCFFLFLAAVAISFLVEWNAAGAPAIVARQAASGDQYITGGLLGKWIEDTATFLNTNAQWVVLIWFVVLVFKSCRVALDVHQLRRIRHHKTRAVGTPWTKRAQALAGGIGIQKKILLVESAVLNVPIVIGHFKPLILVPVGMLAHLPPEEVEAILLHELAHIRRHDYLVNFIQRSAETVFFFNPGLLWVSSLLRIERENCCDDVAINRTGNKLQLVEALIRCKELSLQAPGHALGLYGKKHLLLQRVTRIVSNRNKTLSSFEAGFLVLNLLAVVLLFSSMSKADPFSVNRSTKTFLLRGNAPAASVVGADTHQTALEKQTKKGLGKPTRKLRSHPNTGTQTPALKQKSTTPVLTKVKEQTAPASGVIEDLSLLDEREGSGKTNKDRVEPEDAAAMRTLAVIQRQMAERDREQARRDRVQAEQDREQAMRDREQAAKDRQQAERERKKLNDQRLAMIEQLQKP